MTDQNSQDSLVEDTGQADIQGAKEGESLQHAADAVIDSNSPSIAHASAGFETRVYALGAVAATLGILSGFAFALFAGHSSPRSAGPDTSPTNSNAPALAAFVKPQPADTTASQAELQTAPTPADPQPRAAGHRKAKKKMAVATEAFAIEGDDELVGFDPSKGIIQTSAKKFILVSANPGARNSAKWQESPSNIHYKCDLYDSCTLSRKGAAVLYARLQK